MKCARGTPIILVHYRRRKSKMIYKILLVMSILSLSPCSFANGEWYESNNVTVKENSLEYLINTEQINVEGLDHTITIRLHTFRSKKSKDGWILPDEWILLEVSKTVNNLQCFNIFDIDIEGIGQINTQTAPFKKPSNQFDDLDTLEINMTFNGVDVRTGSNFSEARIVRVVFEDNSCDVLVQHSW